MADIILSIDLDILFSPYVGIYNKDIHNNYNCTKIWKEIEQNYHIEDFVPNLEYYKIIYDILSIYSQQVDKIYIGIDHSNILTALQLEKNNLLSPYLFKLYNIDYHHDIGYGKALEDIKVDRVNCGNWVGFLNYYHYIDEYYWYDGAGSCYNQYTLFNNLKELMPKQIIHNIFNSYFPMNLDIKLLYITFSPPWIPICYYDTIIEILKSLDQNKIKYLPNPYCNSLFKEPFLDKDGEKGYYDFQFLLNKI